MNSVRARITSKGQVTLPKRIRDALGLSKSAVVEFELREGEAVLKPVSSGGFLALYGSVRPRRSPEDWSQVRAETRAATASRAVRRGRRD